MRSVTKSLSDYLPIELEILPPVIKSEILLNVTRHGDGYGYCTEFRVLKTLLHKGVQHLDLCMCQRITDKALEVIVNEAPYLRELKISTQKIPIMITPRGSLKTKLANLFKKMQ